MKELKVKRGDSVDCYMNLKEVFKENAPEFLRSLSEEDVEAMEHFGDFENYVFLVINYETVSVLFDSELTGIYSMKKFQKLALDVIHEDN